MPSSYIRSSNSPASSFGKYNPMTGSKGKGASPFSMQTQAGMEDILSALGGQKGLVKAFQMPEGPDYGAQALMSGGTGLLSGGPISGLLGFLSSALTHGIDRKMTQKYGQDLLASIGIGQSGQTFTKTFNPLSSQQLASAAGLKGIDPTMLRAVQQGLSQGSLNAGYAGAGGGFGLIDKYARLASLMSNQNSLAQSLAGPQFGKELSSVQGYY